MPNDFTPTTLKEVQLKWDTAFNGNRIDLPLKADPVTAAVVLEKQTARIDPILVRDYCRGFEVGFLESDSTTIPTAVTSAPAVDCTLPTGDTLSSNQKTYDKNLFLQSTFSVPDADCDNTMKFVDRASKGLMAAMQKLSLGLNNTILARLVANAQTPTYAGDKGTINGNTIEFAAADFATGDAGADLVGYWNEIAIKEYLSSDYYVVNGTNFQALNFNAQFRAANDNQRNQALAFGWDNKMYWDLHNLDNVVGSPSSFVIDPNMVFGGFTSSYGMEMEDIKTTNTFTRVFSMPLQYVSMAQNGVNGSNIRTMQFSNGGVLEPVMVDVEYQLTCDPASLDAKRSSIHTWRLTIKGLFDTAVASAGDGTGILQMVKV